MSEFKTILAEVRKNPGQSVEAIAAGTSSLRNTTAKHLLRLVKLKKVRRERGYYYREVDARRISQFVYFPAAVKPAAPDNPPPDAVQAEVREPRIVPATTGQAPAPDPVPTTLDILCLPLGEARELYRQLRAFFEDKPI